MYACGIKAKVEMAYCTDKQPCLDMWLVAVLAGLMEPKEVPAFCFKASVKYQRCTNYDASRVDFQPLLLNTPNVDRSRYQTHVWFA